MNGALTLVVGSAAVAAALVAIPSQADPPEELSPAADKKRLECPDNAIISFDAIPDVENPASGAGSAEGALEQRIAQDFPRAARSRFSRVAESEDGQAVKFHYRSPDGKLVGSFLAQQFASRWHTPAGAICIQTAKEANQ